MSQFIRRLEETPSTLSGRKRKVIVSLANASLGEMIIMCTDVDLPHLQPALTPRSPLTYVDNEGEKNPSGDTVLWGTSWDVFA